MSRFPSKIVICDPINKIQDIHITLEFIPRVGDHLDLHVRRGEDEYVVTEVHIRYTETGTVNRVLIHARSMNNTTS
jgi:2-phospho-L-lactate transferase/gluconeogenesis factor (CofD/UPF0052 family)